MKHRKPKPGGRWVAWMRGAFIRSEGDKKKVQVKEPKPCRA